MTKLYIVRYYDADTDSNEEFEYNSISHAMETYNLLKDQTGVNELHIVEYDFTAKQYHIIEIS